MRVEKKSYLNLTFVISNSTLLTADGRQHVHWHDPSGEFTEELQKWIKRYGVYKIVPPLPKEPQLYIGEYSGGDELKIYHAMTADQSNAESPGCVKVSVVSYTGRLIPTVSKYHPSTRIVEYDKEIVRGARVNKPPWDVFYKFAWLQDLFSAMPVITDTRSKKERQAVIDSCLFINTAKEMLENPHSLKELRAVLRGIGRNQNVLDDSEARRVFKDVLKCANGDYGKQKAAEMREELSLYFIPKPEQYKARRTPIPDDQRVLLAYDLMRKLTVHFHEKCKAMFCNWNYRNKEDFDYFIRDKDEQARFQDMCKDHRLRAIEPNMIKMLVLSHIEEFLDPQLGEFFGCFPSTFRKHLRGLKTINN